MQFDVNYPQLVQDLTPPFLRSAGMLAWLQAVTRPVAELHALFYEFVYESRKKLKYNSQTMVFEYALNSIFDPAQERIYLVNNPNTPDWQFEFARSENEPDEFEYALEDGQAPQFLYSSYEYYTGLGFAVHVPSSLQAQEVKIRRQVEVLKFAFIPYTIIYF